MPQYHGVSVGIGENYGETAPIKGSSYDYDNRIYFAPVGTDMVLVLSGLPAVMIILIAAAVLLGADSSAVIDREAGNRRLHH